MRAWRIDTFGIENLKCVDLPAPTPGPGEALVQMQALSLNFRDVMVVRGQYNPKLALPAIPLSDGAGVVQAVGEGVTRVQPGDRVMSHFVAGWIDGPFQGDYRRTTLGTPGAGVAAEQVVLPAEAVVPIPERYDFAQAATLPIAALTAWSGLVTEGRVQPGQTVLTLGTGGVAIFTLQLAKALGATVIITSSSDAKLERARQLGADHTINYSTTPNWEARVLEITGGRGTDVTVETVGGRTLNQSLAATGAGGLVALLGALHGRNGEINTGLVLMNRIRIHGILVDSRAAFERMLGFMVAHDVQPVIDRCFAFDQLPEAFQALESGRHFGKLVITL